MATNELTEELAQIEASLEAIDERIEMLSENDHYIKSTLAALADLPERKETVEKLKIAEHELMEDLTSLNKVYVAYQERLEYLEGIIANMEEI